MKKILSNVSVDNTYNNSELIRDHVEVYQFHESQKLKGDNITKRLNEATKHQKPLPTNEDSNNEVE